MVTMATGSITVNLSADLLQAIDQAVRSGIARSRNELILLALGRELKTDKHLDEIEALERERVRKLLEGLICDRELLDRN